VSLEFPDERAAAHQDQYDPDQAIHRQMIGFSELVKRNVRESISYRYETYENYPQFGAHVPFPFLYDGLAVCDNGPSEKVTLHRPDSPWVPFCPSLLESLLDNSA
jgi:hypothetical protein